MRGGLVGAAVITLVLLGGFFLGKGHAVEWSVEDYLSLAGVVFGFACSAYLFYDWLKHGRSQPHVFLWAIGLVFFYPFLLPFVAAKFTESIVLSEWSVFFSATVPLVFLGWAFIYWGILQAKSKSQLLKPPIFLVLWIVTSFIFYVFRFIPTPFEKILSIVGIVVFFLAIHFLILWTLWGWFRTAQQEAEHFWKKAGILVLATATILSIARYLMILEGLLNFPQGFWFLTIATFDIGFILRSVVVILLAVGFLIGARAKTSAMTSALPR